MSLPGITYASPLTLLQRFEDADSRANSQPSSPTSPSPPYKLKTVEETSEPAADPIKLENNEDSVEPTAGPSDPPPGTSDSLTKASSNTSKSGASTATEQERRTSQHSATEEQPRKLVKSMTVKFDVDETVNGDTAPSHAGRRPSRFQLPWGASSSKSSGDIRSPSPQPPQLAGAGAGAGRKASVFGFFMRTPSTKDPKSPPSLSGLDTRRNTTTSISTLGSNPELSMKALEEGDGKTMSRQSLKEQFKMLRMREDTGLKSVDDDETTEGGAIAGLVGHSTSLGVSIASPDSVQGDEKPLPTPIISPTSPVTDPSATVDPKLAPGTVSGMSASASDAAAPINWDFWQTVVNDGPQAVSQKSPEELAAAISSGIPQTIRGVIWQVLAGSKNEELETVYNELRSTGTAQDSKESVSKPSQPENTQNGSVKEKESVSSSRSSIKSDHSTPATSANVGSPTQEASDPISSAKLQADLATEKAKKAKEDAAAVAKLEKMIKRDMGTRTSYSKYTTAAGLQEPLFNVCKAYALYDDAVGYPQGLNFIIMPLLFTMSEEEAFCLLVKMMHKYHLRELFVNDMPGLHLHLYQFERLLEDTEPAVFCHLNRRGVTPKLYATQWFLTLFAYRFPLQLVMRVYDLVLCEGLEGAILKFGMAVVQRNAQALLAMNDMQALTNFLKEKLFDVYIDSTPSSRSILESGFFGSSSGTDSEIYRADILVQDASAIKLTSDMLNKYRQEWEEKTKTEKAKETELENLRTDTATKAAQIRSLEKRAEKSDAEHIEIANELVKLKVENNELHDQNEGLKGQVEELRKVAESEAKHVEEKLRAGTEQVMQRNIEVQNENRHMGEQMTEMEKELVDMKMKFAEVSCAHNCFVYP